MLDRAAMGRLVREWDEAVVAVSDASRLWEVYRRERLESVLRPPAPLEDIEALEERIGLPLPPSFRWFLEISDGAEAAVDALGRPGEGLLSAPHIDRFIRRVPWLPHLRVQVPPEGWFEPDNDPRDGELAWLIERFVDGQGVTLPGHLPHCVAVSGLGDGMAVLLNPLVRDADGEWECVDFFTHDVSRGFRSFADFLVSRRELLTRRLDRYERLDDDDLDGVDEASIERWLTSWQVAPPWFWRQLYLAAPPPRAVEVLRRLIDAGLSETIVGHVARMQGPVAYELAQRSWWAAAGRRSASVTSARAPGATGDVTAELLDVATQLSWTPDPDVRAWLVDVLESHLRDDPDFSRLRTDTQRAARLRNLSGPVVELLWHRSGSEVLLTQLCRWTQWMGVADRARVVDAVSRRLADDDWRERHREHLGDLLDVVVSGGSHVLPLLRSLRAAPQVPARKLAAALLRLDDHDLAYAARHLRISQVDRPIEVPDELRAEHRRARVAAVTASLALRQSQNEVLEDLAGHNDPEATELLMSLRGTVDNLRLALSLERQRSPAAADALAMLASDEPHAWRCLARLGDRRAAGPLLDLLDHPHPEARRFAARGLRELGTPAAVGQLADRALHDPDPDVLCAAAHTTLTAGVDGSALLERLADLEGDHGQLSEHWRALRPPADV